MSQKHATNGKFTVSVLHGKCCAIYILWGFKSTILSKQIVIFTVDCPFGDLPAGYGSIGLQLASKDIISKKFELDIGC